MKLKLLTVAFATSALLFTGLFAAEKKMGMEKMTEIPFSGPTDVAYSKKLWEKLEASGLNSVEGNLYVGGPPHGKVRETVEGIIDGKRIIVKRNYGGKDITIEKVEQNSFSTFL